MTSEFILAFPDETLGDVAAQLPPERAARRRVYLAVDTGDGGYWLVRWDALEDLAATQPLEAAMLLADLPDLPPPVAAVEQQGLEAGALDELRLAQPGGRLVLLSRGTPVAVLDADPPPAPPSIADPFAAWFGQEKAIDFSPPPIQPPIPPVDPSIPTPGSSTALPPVAEDQRVVNVWVENLGPDEPLEVGRAYGLAFDVDLPRADARATTGGIANLVQQLRPDQEHAEILILIESDDVQITGPSEDTLLVPRVGPSQNQAVFDITPLHPGPCVVKALLLANNRVFQKLTLHFQAGSAAAALDAQSSGITLDSALAQPPTGQLLNIMLLKQSAGYQLILERGGISKASLNLSEVQIAELVAYARRQLKAIVYTQDDGGRLVYQQPDTTIATPTHQQTLKALAKLGYYLYQKLFYAPGSGPDAQALGASLRQLSQQQQLTVRIASERFVFPWALLYDRDPLDLEHVDPEGFWGFKHVVEYLPEFSSAAPVAFSPQIEVAGDLRLGFVCNTLIDRQLQRPLVAGQSAFLAALPRVALHAYPTCQDLYDLLSTDASAVQLIYAYCHAESFVPGEGAVQDSRLLLSDGAVALDDLNIFAPTNRPLLRQAPLVFLNACQSAALSPYLYDGLVPYLIARGARGVIGTEVDTPALFGAEFAQELLRRLLVGNLPLGRALLELRREYCFQRNNPLGLLYALYSSGDLSLRWAA